MTGRASSSFRQGIWMIVSSAGHQKVAPLPASGRRSDENGPHPGGRLSRHPVIADGRPDPHPAARDARARSLDGETVARVAFGLLCVAVAVGFFIYPTYPNYDSYYSLLWGREVLDLTLPGFEGFRVPTEHPLAIAAGAVLSLFGDVRRPDVDRAHLRVVPVADLGRLPAGPDRLHAARRRDRGGARAHALRLRLPGRPRLHRHPVHGPRHVGGRGGGAAAATRGPGAAAAGRRRDAAARGMGARRPLLALAVPEGDVARPRGLRGAGRARPARVDADRLDRHRRPAVLAALHERLGGGPRPPADAVRAAHGDPRLPDADREAADHGRGAGRPRPGARPRAAAHGDAAGAVDLRHRHVRAHRGRRARR